MLPPHHYAWTQFFTLLHAWLYGHTDRNDTYAGFKLFWLARWGSVINFIAGLSVVIEIIGKETIRAKMRGFDNVIVPRQLIYKMKDVFNFNAKVYTSWQPFKIVFFLGLLLRAVDEINSINSPVPKPTPSESGSSTTALIIVFSIIYLPFLLLIFRKTRSFARWFIQFPYVLIYKTFALLIQLMIELVFFKPIILYLRVSTNDRNSKIFSFFALLVGFCMSLVFS